jgi:hypothetical protein
MAKIKLGAIVVDMSGKLGGHVFAKNRGGNYMRTKTTPTNPRTSFQSAVRAMFATISSGWSALTDANRKSFENLVGAYAKTNVFGDLKSPTAKALYQRLNQNLMLSGQAVIATALPPAAVIAPLVNTATATAIDGSIAINFESASIGSQILISATPVLSHGTTFIKNKLRQIAVEAGTPSNVISLPTEYTERFGSFVAGDNVWISVVYINNQGQASPPQSAKLRII